MIHSAYPETRCGRGGARRRSCESAALACRVRYAYVYKYEYTYDIYICIYIYIYTHMCYTPMYGCMYRHICMDIIDIIIRRWSVSRPVCPGWLFARAGRSAGRPGQLAARHPSLECACDN